MNLKKYFATITLVNSFIIIISAMVIGQSRRGQITSQGQQNFQWPEGKRAAISLSFDDGRPSQIDNGIPIFDRYNVKATFYVSPSGVEKRLDDWKKALANGHEIGNHTLSHPCTINYGSNSKNVLENYTLEMMEQEMDGANVGIEKLLGVKPSTFAYPCGQKYVGRGRNVKSYIPLVAERFIVGREWLSENSNTPASCDLSHVMGMKIDGMTFEQVKELIDQTVKNRKWLVLCGHNINPSGRGLTTFTSTLEELCKYAQDPANGLWIDTVENIGRYILEHRANSE